MSTASIFPVIFIIVLIGVFFAEIRFNLKNSTGKNKKVIVMTDIVMVGVIAVLLFATLINSIFCSGYKKKYDMERGTVFAEMQYVDTTDGYHIIHKNAFLGEGIYIAIPEKAVSISFMSCIVGDVIIFCEKDRPLYTPQSKKNIGGYECNISHSARAIFPDYFWINLIFGVFDVLICFLFNFVEMFIVRHKMKKTE